MCKITLANSWSPNGRNLNLKLVGGWAVTTTYVNISDVPSVKQYFKVVQLFLGSLKSL